MICHHVYAAETSTECFMLRTECFPSQCHRAFMRIAELDQSQLVPSVATLG